MMKQAWFRFTSWAIINPDRYRDAGFIGHKIEHTLIALYAGYTKS
jgi:hypothetical protein